MTEPERHKLRERAWNEIVVATGAFILAGAGVEVAAQGNVLDGSAAAVGFVAVGALLARAGIQGLRSTGRRAV